MHSVRSVVFVIILVLVQMSSCTAQSRFDGVTFYGCTPGDQEIRTLLHISEGRVIDFIRWHLSLADDGNFSLDISYGESNPNTLALKPDSGYKKVIGTYTKSDTKDLQRVYKFRSETGDININMVAISDNLLHFQTGAGKLMVGNGGWSYQLNRRLPVEVREMRFQSVLTDDTSRQMVFDGKTPCKQISGEHPEMKTSDACFKLKWQLILERDTATLQPTTYTIRKVVDGEARMVTGRWRMQMGEGAQRGMIFYVLDQGKETSMSFLAGSNDVLIFLDQQLQPVLGNEHFSVALNRRK